MATNIKARRKLSELYKRGVEVRFGPGPDGVPKGRVGPFVNDDGEDIPAAEDEVSAWVCPPSPLQREMALRESQAARARALVRARREKESEEYLTSMAFIVEMEDNTLVDYLMVGDMERRRQDAIREVLAEDEWKDILTYQDAFAQVEAMSEEEQETSEDYKAMMEMDAKFGEQVAERERELYEAQYEGLRILGRKEWERRALDKRGEIAASQVFMAEYERQMMFYSVRDADDHGVLFYESARECAEQEDEIREVFSEALDQFIGDVGEVKNSPRADSGSEPSEPPSEPETTESSTQETVIG